MNNYTIPNLVKACNILKVIACRPEGIPAVAIEDIVDVPRTTAFRILKTLCAEDFVVKRGTLFFAGPALVQVGLNSLKSTKISTEAIPLLRDLAISTNLTSHLAVPCGFQSLILEVHDSPSPLRVASRSGTAVQMHCSSTGKIFLAHIYHDRLDEYFEKTVAEKHTENTIVTVEQMKQELEWIRANGYAVDRREFHEDVCCLAAPVRNDKGDVIAAIGVTGAAMSFTDEVEKQIVAEVTKIADRLSAIMGYNTNEAF